MLQPLAQVALDRCGDLRSAVRGAGTRKILSTRRGRPRTAPTARRFAGASRNDSGTEHRRHLGRVGTCHEAWSPAPAAGREPVTVRTGPGSPAAGPARARPISARPAQRRRAPASPGSICPPGRLTCPACRRRRSLRRVQQASRRRDPLQHRGPRAGCPGAGLRARQVPFRPAGSDCSGSRARAIRSSGGTRACVTPSAASRGAAVPRPPAAAAPPRPWRPSG